VQIDDLKSAGEGFGGNIAFILGDGNMVDTFHERDNVGLLKTQVGIILVFYQGVAGLRIVMCTPKNSRRLLIPEEVACRRGERLRI
jgi:hypothetical protein